MIPRRPAFRFDAEACSGCKACQMACRDRHDLEAGRHWRRISEVSGGGWRRAGAAAGGWRHDVFAYHLSISCNHCERPICVEACPARAITGRDDGVVLLDPDHCLGCGYCAWACPYSAPQYLDEAGTMSKCSFCVEDIDAGQAPACVSACPVRALDWGDADELLERYPDDLSASAPPPLPSFEMTEPRLRLAPHADASRSSEPETQLDPVPPRGLREWSLVAFTILAQMAAGIAICLGAVRCWALLKDAQPVADDLDATGLIALSLVLGLAMGVSTLHLGRKRNLHRALLNLRTSWLSREVLVALFLLTTTVAALWPGSLPGWEGFSLAMRWLTLPAALALVAGMARVYMLRTVPAWNTLMTPLAFLLTALLLGALLLNALVWSQSGLGPGLLAWAAWALALAREVAKRKSFYGAYRRVGT